MVRGAMDAMETESLPVWAQDVDVFTSPDWTTPEAARSKSLGAIVERLNAGSFTFLDLLRGMESCLVTTDDAKRARGVLLLAEAVAGYRGSPGGPPASLPSAAAELLSQFFASKLEDFAVVRAALMGCTSLLNGRDSVSGEALVSHETATTMADRLFEAVHVPSLVQADRLRSYEMLLALCLHPSAASPTGPPLGSTTPSEQLESLVASCDGEKDPRNVLVVCELWKHVPRAFCGALDSNEKNMPSQTHRDAFKNAAEELYDVVAAYFPVSFRPPPGDAIKVTHDDLASTLRDAMCASPTYAPWAVPHILESVDSEKAPRVMADALASLAACGAAFGRTAMKPHIVGIWFALRGVLLRPPAGEDMDAEGAAKWATMLFAAEWSGGDGGAADGSLAALALSDPCLSDAAAALAPNTGESSGCCGGGASGEGTEAKMEAPHEHTHGGGCCGGEDESAAADANAKEVTNRGHAILAAAGRVLGAVAAAGPDAAASALAKGVSPLLDAAGITEDGDCASVAPGVAPLALVLATPATCGALDGVSRSAAGQKPIDVLGTVGVRLVSLFAAAATKTLVVGATAKTENDDSIDADDGATLGVAGLRTLLSFPSGFGLTVETHTSDALLALVNAATASDKNSSSLERAADLRRRAGDALGSAASASDEKIAAAAETIATPALLALATTFSSTDAVHTAKRALEALARVVATAPATRRVALGPLCDAVMERATSVASEETSALAFVALADALAGDTSVSRQRAPPGILQTAAMTDDAVSSDTSKRTALLDSALASAPLADAFASASVADAACRLTRAATAACSAEAQPPLLLAAEQVITRRYEEAKNTQSLQGTHDTVMDDYDNCDTASANDVSFRIAAATFAGARADVRYPADEAKGMTVTSALATLATSAHVTETVSIAAAHALASLVHKRGASGALGVHGGLAAATAGGIASDVSLGTGGLVGSRAAGGVLRALAARNDPAARVLANKLVSKLKHENDIVACSAGRALGEAMSPSGGGVGATRACHGFEKPLFRQRFFAQTLPDVLTGLSSANAGPGGSQGRPAYIAAVVHLARHAPGSAVFQAGEKILPLLPEAAAALADSNSKFADHQALAAAVVLLASFFSDQRGRKALEIHAEAHAGAMLRALCALAGAGAQKSIESQTHSQASLEVRETALEALVAATSLPFSAVYPHRKEVSTAATTALDDPKRRVRRAAARCREVWLALDAKS